MNTRPKTPLAGQNWPENSKQTILLNNNEQGRAIKESIVINMIDFREDSLVNISDWPTSKIEKAVSSFKYSGKDLSGSQSIKADKMFTESIPANLIPANSILPPTLESSKDFNWLGIFKKKSLIKQSQERLQKEKEEQTRETIKPEEGQKELS